MDEASDSRPNGREISDLQPPGLLLATAETDAGRSLTARYVDRGWRVTHVTDGAAAIAAAGLGGYALIRLASDLPLVDAPTVAARIARDDPSVPIRIATPDDGSIDAPSAFAHRPAPPYPNPLGRLAPMLGPAAVRQLMQRFHERLVLLRDAPDPYAIGEGTTPHTLAHRVGGLAGILGFADLAAAWLAVETDGIARIDAAWIETRIAAATLELLLERPISDAG